MKSATISDLKNRLSYYLRFVRRGETVLVLDRDRAIARIEPIGAGAAAGDVAELVRAGVLRPPEFATVWAGGRLDRVFHTFDERLAHAARLEGFVVPSDAAD
jgi:antitoxin (DNA-binding transcriptional repressor) of toxin-antitoxin stability system